MVGSHFKVLSLWKVGLNRSTIERDLPMRGVGERVRIGVGLGGMVGGSLVVGDVGKVRPAKTMSTPLLRLHADLSFAIGGAWQK